MDASQTNDDLQSAINGIVNGAAATTTTATPTNTTTTDVPDLGIPPVPATDLTMPDFGGPLPDLTNPAPMEIGPMPAVEPAPAAPVVPEVAPVEVSAPVEAPVEAPVVPVIPELETAPVTTDVFAGIAENASFSDVKEDMIRELLPIVDKVAIEPEKKFELYKHVIKNSHDQAMVADAYKVVKEILDEKAKAEALLFLISEAE